MPRLDLPWFAVAYAILSSSSLACSSSTPPSDAGGDVAEKDSTFADSKIRDSGTDRPVVDGGRPLLTSLSVTVDGDGSSPITLIPQFSSNIYDYYVRCAAGPNALLVSMTASAGSESVLIEPTRSKALPTQTLSVSAHENDAIVGGATNGTVTTEYWVRCLPHDFPVLQWSLHPDAGTPAPGYYLVGNNDVSPGEAGYAMVLDSQGVPVWYYRQSAVAGVVNVDNVVDGAISFVAPPDPHYYVHELAPPGTTRLPPADEHELRYLKNGDFLVIRNTMVNGLDLTGLKLKLADGGFEDFGPNQSILTCDIYELAPDGGVVSQWNGLDHLDPVKDCTFPMQLKGLTGPDGGPVVDPFHCNSIDVDPANGNLLISARNTDSVFYMERSTGNILWKMGGTAFTKDVTSYISVPDPFLRQHDARLQPGWSHTCSGDKGQVSMFDDQTSAPGPARGVVYDVTVALGDGGAGADCGAPAPGPTAATVVWQYKGSVDSVFLGSLRTQPDGSHVIGWGTRSKDRITFTEVDKDGNDLLDLTIDPDGGNESYRAPKVPLNAFDLSVLRASVGHP